MRLVAAVQDRRAGRRSRRPAPGRPGACRRSAAPRPRPGRPRRTPRSCPGARPRSACRSRRAASNGPPSRICSAPGDQRVDEPVVDRRPATTSRAPAEQTWPECRKTAVSAMSTAVSKSASAKTTLGFLPPSSSATRLTVAAASAMTRRPETTPPVKRHHVDPRVAWSAARRRPGRRRAPGWPRPAAGRPPRAPASAGRRSTGVSSLGLRTKVLPASSAGRDLPRRSAAAGSSTG